MSTQVANNNNWTHVVDQRKISCENSREKKNDDDFKKIFTYCALVTLKGDEANGVWSVIKLADDLINKMLRDPANQRNMAEISLVRFLADRGFHLDYMITLPSGGEVEFGDLLTSPEFEELLFKGLNNNYHYCKKHGGEYGFGSKWTNFHIKRFEGESPDLMVRIWFDQNFDPKQIVDLPRYTKQVEQKQLDQQSQQWQENWESDAEEEEEWQEDWDSDDEPEGFTVIFKNEDFPLLPSTENPVSTTTTTTTATFDSFKSVSGVLSDSQMAEKWSKNNSASWADDDDE